MARAARALSASEPALPRIAVISDVAVERTGAGSLLLYRLLKGYPTDRLWVFYNPGHASQTAGVRLPDVRYEPLEYRLPKLIRNRFNPFWPIAGSHHVRLHARQVLRALGKFQPEAVLSVANGFLWFTADAVAQKLQIPLHLFLHEDWPQLVTLSRSGRVQDLVRAVARKRIEPIFRRAGARFSVSPGMADEVFQRYNVKTEVVYPSRGDDSATPLVRVRSLGSLPPTVAHAGFIHLKGNAALLREMADILRSLGGHLDLYTTHTDEDLARFGLTPPVVRRIGFFPAKEFAERVASTAHALVLTASFNEEDRAHEGTLFPSKLADYTAIGVPILVWGPPYSSAARWAAQNPGAALLFTDPSPEAVRSGVLSIVGSEERARSLAQGAVDAGKKFFELSSAREQLERALLRAG